jgi:predicted TIM-barrel fold metal-dependent hydrolase
MATTNTKFFVIDSHLHVWANEDESSKGGFPYAKGKDPPASLLSLSSKSKLLEQMNANGINGALIVQPINHLFDHSYVISALKEHPTRFKGMYLHNPSLSVEDALSKLDDFVLQGFVGARFNPYLWPLQNNDEPTSWTYMSTKGGSGLAVYRRCGELNMPVAVMCFQGLQLHYEDIVQLLEASPKTTLILDHFGFTFLTPEGDAAFQQLLALATYPQVMVKISALFRLKDISSPYEQVRTKRFLPLLSTFGANRLMFGTDFPYVLEQEPEQYGGMIKLVSSWIESESDRMAIMGGTAERAFGAWGISTES